jgi:hypothetical protein
VWEGAHLGVGVEVVAHVPQACVVRTRERASERGGCRELGAQHGKEFGQGNRGKAPAALNPHHCDLSGVRESAAGVVDGEGWKR